jgi:hypothetical protein
LIDLKLRSYIKSAFLCRSAESQLKDLHNLYEKAVVERDGNKMAYEQLMGAFQRERAKG